MLRLFMRPAVFGGCAGDCGVYLFRVSAASFFIYEYRSPACPSLPRAQEKYRIRLRRQSKLTRPDKPNENRIINAAYTGPGTGDYHLRRGLFSFCRRGVDDVNRRNGVPFYSPKREPLGYTDNRVTCTERGELCAGCPYPKHGFICWFQDGGCLKTEMRKITERRRK